MFAGVGEALSPPPPQANKIKKLDERSVVFFIVESFDVELFWREGDFPTGRIKYQEGHFSRHFIEHNVCYRNIWIRPRNVAILSP